MAMSLIAGRNADSYPTPIVTLARGNLQLDGRAARISVELGHTEFVSFLLARHDHSPVYTSNSSHVGRE